QQRVHHRVGHGDHPRELRPEVHVVVRVDEEDPLDERDRGQDDDRVEDRSAARLRAELAEHEHHAEHGQRGAGQVGGVGDRRRRGLAVQRDLVEREDRVPDDLAQKSEGEELPGEAPPSRQVARRSHEDGGDRGRADDDVEDGLPVGREQEVDDDRERPGAHEGRGGREGSQATCAAGSRRLTDGGTRQRSAFRHHPSPTFSSNGVGAASGARCGASLDFRRIPLTPQTGGRVKKRIYAGTAVSAVIAIVAMVATVSGAVARSGATPLPASSCSAIQNASGNLLIASDLPLQGSGRTQTLQMTRAIKFIFQQHNWKAGKYTLAYQSCDDATAQAGKWDSGKASANANAYAQNSSVAGVLGTFNSGAAEIEIPILNRAPNGPIAMISPANTYVGLTHGGPGTAAGEPGKYYPTGKRNYARVVAADDYQGAADAILAKALGVKKVFIL